ncbi:MAG: hypothetical protein M3323_02880 [Actinomycetota bacterium]|nr:hypothetical protein [Actinomycetota bacterium]
MTDGRAEALETLIGSDESSIEVAERFDSTVVTIRVGRGSERLALALANLLVRLGTRLSLEGAEMPSAPSRLDCYLRKFIEPRLTEGSDLPTRCTRFVVDVGFSGTNADLYVSSDGWNLSVSRDPHPVLSGKGPAVNAAAALAASIIFRELLPELPSTALADVTLEWNLVNYELRHTARISRAGPVMATCFGGGSVGSSTIYTLLLSEAEGVIDLVDPDTLEERNRWRYPAFLSESSGPKTGWLEGLAADSTLRVQGHQTDAANYIFDLEDSAPALAISAVDSIAARRDITDLLARTTINVGVNRLSFHVSRHLFGDESGCLYCPFLDVSDPADEVDVYAEMTDLSRGRIRELLRGDVISEADLAVMHVSVSGDSVQFPVDEFRAFVRRYLYAQAPVAIAGGEVAVSAPFVSALAGSLAAAEVLKEAAGGEDGVDRRVDVDCSGFPTGFQRAVRRDESRKCLCWDPRRLKKYASLWGPPPSAVGVRHG